MLESQNELPGLAAEHTAPTGLYLQDDAEHIPDGGSAFMDENQHSFDELMGLDPFAHVVGKYSTD